MLKIRKAYVKVVATFDTEGVVHPNVIYFDDGKQYKIDKILDVRQAASLKAGGVGIRYTVRIMGKDTFLFLEDGCWFIEAKC